jgi:hypothetical protein
MKNKIESLIRLGKLELEKQTEADPFLPQRLLARLQTRSSRQVTAARKLAWATVYGLAVALLVLIHLQWLPGPTIKPSFESSVIKLTPFPKELQNTLYQSFIEVAKWEK